MTNWRSMEENLQEFEREQWGTNDMPTIIRAIKEGELRAAQERMTGMAEEQADWEEGGDD